MHVDAVEAVGLAAASFLVQRDRVSVALVSAVESGLLPLSKHKVVSSLESLDAETPAAVDVLGHPSATLFRERCEGAR